MVRVSPACCFPGEDSSPPRARGPDHCVPKAKPGVGTGVEGAVRRERAMEKRWTTALAAGLILAGAGASALAAAPDDDGMGGQPPPPKAPAAPAATAAEDVPVLEAGTPTHGPLTARNESASPPAV